MAKTILVVDGMDRGQLDKALLEIYHSKLKFMLHPEAKKAIAWHKKAGRKVVIVSNNLSVMLQPTIDDWGIDQIIANEVRYDANKVIGQYSKDICYGAGKISRLKELPYYNDIDFSKSYFYSDSFYDIPLLEFVGKPIVINADIKLSRWAKLKKVEKHTWS